MKSTAAEIGLSSTRITRRALLLGSAQVGLMGVLGYRMNQLQVQQSDRFRLLAEENRINVRLIPPVRGLIYDSAGRAVAINEPNYRLTITRDIAGDVDKVLSDLQQIIAIDEETLAKAQKNMARRSPFVPVTIIQNLSWDDFAKVAANAPALPGISTDVGYNRSYPMGANLAHVVGYVGPVSDYDLSQIEDPDPLLQIPRFQIGKTGVEAQMEPNLRGKAGTQKIEVNAAGRVMRTLDRVESNVGDTMQLTINTELQNYALARMEGMSASAVVIDTTNGDIRAIASSPTFDANLFVEGISVADYNGLRENELGPLRAKAVQGTYPPASTFKMITALAALEAGEMDAGERIKCSGSIEVHKNKFHCWKRGGHGNMDLIQAIMQSCDVYFYDIAQRVGIEKITEMAKRFGLGVKHDVPLSAVQSGLMPTKEWKQQVKKQQWVIGDTVNASIGQGFLLASPLQLAVMSARLATGRIIEPRLVQSINGTRQPSGDVGEMGVNPDHLSKIQNAMFGVTNRKKGTAYQSRTLFDEFRMAGKTGTAQVRRITADERKTGVRKTEDLPRKHRDHALYVNFAPYDNPKYAVAVVVEHGGGGSAVAAPIARDITLFALNGGLPPIEAYPSEIRTQIAAEQAAIREKLDTFGAPAAEQSDQA